MIVDEAAWVALESLASESHRSISRVLAEAVQDYVRRRQVRPNFLHHFEDGIGEKEDPGLRLAE